MLWIKGVICQEEKPKQQHTQAREKARIAPRETPIHQRASRQSRLRGDRRGVGGRHIRAAQYHGLSQGQDAHQRWQMGLGQTTVPP